MKSFQAFQTLLQQYPKSPYAADARQRMVYLRNRLADYEVEVARYYMKRGAYVGAANRAKGVIVEYDGAPAVDDALRIMAAAYRRLGIEDLALTVDKVRSANVQCRRPGHDARCRSRRRRHRRRRGCGGRGRRLGQPLEHGCAGAGRPLGGDRRRDRARWPSDVDFEGGTTAEIDSGSAWCSARATT